MPGFFKFCFSRFLKLLASWEHVVFKAVVFNVSDCFFKLSSYLLLLAFLSNFHLDRMRLGWCRNLELRRRLHSMGLNVDGVTTRDVSYKASIYDDCWAVNVIRSYFFVLVVF